MSWGFRKRIKLFRGADLNLGKRSMGLSVGRKGARLSANSRGRRALSLGWKGFFWRRKI